MKRKTINSILRKKFNELLESIDNEDVRKLVAQHGIITGGAIVSLLLNEAPNDYDIYFTDKATVKAACQYYCDKFNEAHADTKNNIGKSALAWVLDGEDVAAWKEGKKQLSEFAYNYRDREYSDAEDGHSDCVVASRMITNTTPDRIKVIVNSDGVAQDEDYEAPSDENVTRILEDADVLPGDAIDPDDGKPKYRPLLLTTNAISLSDKVQIVTRFYGNAAQIHENFDYIHCTCYWESATGNLVLPGEALEAILAKQLVYRGSKYPFCSIVRTRKFLQRGWTIDAGQYLKMAFQLSELDLTDVDVLEDQLVGVDTLYFKGVIHALQQMKEKDSSFTVSSSYVNTIIDKVFG
jgi:hypothetical protein